MDPLTDDPRPAIDCMACGYSLRGLAVEGNCPECGVDVRTSIGSAFTFRRRELVVLACRLLAIWMIVMFARAAAAFVGQLGLVASMSGTGYGPELWVWVLTGGATLMIQLIAAAALWWGAGWFSRRIFGRDGPAGFGLSSASAGSSVREDLSAVAFAAVGIYLFVSAIGPTIAAAFLTTPYGNMPNDFEFVAIIDPLVRGIAGILLLLRAGTVVRLLTWLRTAGTTPPQS